MKVKYYLGIITLFICLTANITAQQPTAEIISEDVKFCESGDAIIKIKFTGTAPFAFDYRYDGSTYFEDGGGNINEDNFQFTVNISSSSIIELVTVYDANYPPTGSGSDQISGEMNVQIDEIPTVIAGSDINECGYEIELNGSITGTTTEKIWSDGISGGSFTDINSPTTVYTNNKTGTYTLTLQAINGECTATDQVDVTLKGRPTGSFNDGSAERFCSTDGTEDNISIDLNFTGVAPFTYKLKNQDASITYGDFTATGLSHSPSIPVSKSETISFLSITDAQNCTSEAADMTGQKPITDVKPNVDAGTGSDKYCGNEFSLSALPSPGTTGVWTSSSADVSFLDNTVANTTATMAFESFEFNKPATMRWTETTTDEFSCAHYKEIEVNYIKKPTVAIESIVNERICQKGGETTVNLNLNKPFPLTLNYNYNGNYENTVLTSPQLTIQGEGFDIGNNTIFFTKIEDDNNCYTEYSGLSQDILIDEMPYTNAGADIDSCGPKVTLSAIPSIGIGQWQLADGTFTDRNDPNTKFEANETGVQTLYWKETNESCHDIDEVVVNFSPSPDPVLDEIEFDTIYATNSIELNTLPLTDGEGEWIAPIGSEVTFDNPTNNKTWARNLEAGNTYKLTWKATLESAPEQCRHKYHYVEVTSKPLITPQGISPDANSNGTFKILGDDNLNNSKLSIFDENGKLVFKRDNYRNNDRPFNGIDLNGNKLPSGTYYYVLEADELSTPIRDYLIIKRK